MENEWAPNKEKRCSTLIKLHNHAPGFDIWDCCQLVFSPESLSFYLEFFLTLCLSCKTLSANCLQTNTLVFVKRGFVQHCDGAHTKRRKTKRRKQNVDKTKRRQYKTSTRQKCRQDKKSTKKWNHKIRKVFKMAIYLYFRSVKLGMGIKTSMF
jgi:hypothetical protein